MKRTLLQKQSKIILVVACGGAALIVMAAIAGALLFDINSYKPGIEAAASRATGLDVSINGKMRLSFFPFGLSAADLHAANHGVEILSLEKLKLGLEFIPLLKKKLIITRCVLDQPVLTLIKDARRNDPSSPAENKASEMGMKKVFSLKELSLFRGVLVYVDQKTREQIVFRDIHLAIHDFLLEDISANPVQNASFSGTFQCSEVEKANLKINHVLGSMKAEKGVLTLNPLTLDVFGGKGKGDASVDLSGVHGVYKINLKIPELDFANLEKALGAKKMIGGKGDLEASLTLEEKENLRLMSGVNGHFSLSGDHLILYTLDLDKALTAYESSQQFNLVDLGAFFIVGPLGTVGLKGHGYWETYRQTHGRQGKIHHLVSRWKIKQGIAEALDCALATQHNRVALSGQLNLVRERYEKVTVALVDGKGCAKFKQSITGPFGSPEIGALSTVETLGGPLLSLYRKTKRFVQGDKCDVFYSGSVRHP
ncbi:MAG: AsmA family protein [Desulfobacteraceae bacterium]|nr:AsmA family protein [Desulfobacteraceae bacterium]